MNIGLPPVARTLPIGMMSLSEVLHGTRTKVFPDEFKREAVKLTRQPGASKAAIARDLGVGANLLRRWAREEPDPTPQGGKNEGISSQEYERMRRELAKVKTERDILKRRSATSQPTPSEVRLYRPTLQHLANENDVSGFRRLCQRFL